MFYWSLLLEVAARTSNWHERRQIVESLKCRNNSQTRCTTKLTPLDIWKIDKVASKLAVQPVKESYEKGSVEQGSIIQEIKQCLNDYKLYELNLSSLSQEDREELLKPHRNWLKVYKEALETMEFPKDDFSESCWCKPDIYYGKYAKVAEPFLRLLSKKLQAVCQEINLDQSTYTINKQAIADIQLHLLDRLELALAWALEADIKVYCAQNKIAKSVNDRDAYIDYLNKTFDNWYDYHRFYCKFPVLGRWLAQVTEFLSQIGEEVIQRLTSDRCEISDRFFDGRSITQIKSLKLGKSDTHAGGKSVIFVELELNHSEAATIVYKPRCIQSEAGMQSFLENLTDRNVIKFGTYKLLCKQDYGYAEFIPGGKNNIQSEREIDLFYRQLGGYLAIFHILGGSDIHYENILVADGNAFICDCETVLEVVLKNRDKFSDTVFDSVFKTAMLEWPRTNKADASNEIKTGAYAGGESYQVSFPVPRINNCRMSLAPAVEYKTDVVVEGKTNNRIYYQGQLVKPQDHKNSIVDGFNQVYNWFQNNQTLAIAQLEESFASSSVRFINWGTQAYSKLIVSAQHPKCLAEPLEVDLLFKSLTEHCRQWDKQGNLAKLELTAMWQLDVPIFTAKATSSHELIYNYETPLPDTLEISPLENAIQRIHKLSTENRTRQNQYIYASLSVEEIHNPYFIASAVNYAQQVGQKLCDLLEPDSNKAPWKTYEFTALGKRFVDIRGDLYEGTAGICLFLAYLDAIEPRPVFRQAAEKALAYSIEHRNKVMIGAYQGKAGLIYLLTHLAQLWEQPYLLNLAVDLVDELIPNISQDRYFDVLQGVAGIIPVMVNLAEATSGKGIDCAHRCAQHLLKHATVNNNTLSWSHHVSELAQRNLTGFSHGAGGVGWTLILLGCYTNKSEYIAAGRQAFAYEAIHLDPNEHDWYDLRTSMMDTNLNKPHFANAWCNGAAGIGLSRIASWAILGKTDDDILRDAYMALNATLRNFEKLGNDSLCHGKAGNGEVFLQFAKLREEPYLQMEANVQAQAQWRNFEKAGHWICGGGGTDIYPGLMLGLAGIGMHFLRLAYPDRIPSPLLLEPSPKLN
ncbi:type 2 lanthipeptide synthetase LanM family protein [Roseofilum capinflatum]|uniref:Type 2 lanthipeptide synthetase LanM family protein n=1 Tax=Roseofilum capinflatum BLCC-M114 TaxID=3022440 RepID=A0ABT7B6W4_9CYAN|nr:type 2 lanthipeptide synthetase LanM family protein [Roseofilum capinflatum]MDJ1174291.1 type 2 lanthipeptide synthetase LanM family protein [Roseofilum capinflatum BLCC-M114]